MSAANEDWEPLPGFSRYEISSLGRARRVNWRPRTLKPMKSSGRGYISYNLTSDAGRPVHLPAHCAVLAAFRGPRPEGFVGAHLDGDKFNNAITNLAWVTPEENYSHMHIHGTTSAGERHPQHKLTSEQVIAIRREARVGLRPNTLNSKSIARKYGMSERQTIDILYGRRWAKTEPHRAIVLDQPSATDAVIAEIEASI
jgi:hypothetical protein